MSERLSCVGLLGGGVIGGGWAARFALNGIDVRIYDPDPRASQKVGQMLDNARRAYRQLTSAPLPVEGTVTFVQSPEAAVEDVGFVQESAPERPELKQRLLAKASHAARVDVPFCSSTSGLRPSLLQAEMEHPERLLVGHPFNPVYLLPLVELCGGRQTDPDVLPRAATVYQSIGMHPLTLRTEVDGFIADRLLEALWREALWLVHDDIATVEEVDDAIRYGAGLRWALMGTFLTYRIAGGEAGMRHFLEQFGPTLTLPWTKLVDVPELDESLLTKLVSQSDAQSRGRSTTDLERWRDDCLIGVLGALRAQRAGAGESVAAWERDLWQLPLSAAQDEREPQPVPCQVLARTVPSQWVTECLTPDLCCQELFDDATAAFLKMAGVDEDHVAAHGTFRPIESRTSHLAHLRAGDRVRVTTQVLQWANERLRVAHLLYRDDADKPLAICERTLLHVDPRSGEVTAAGDRLDNRLRLSVSAGAAIEAETDGGRG